MSKINFSSGLLLFSFLFLVNSSSFSQNTDSVFISKIYKSALTQGNSYEDLRQLCKDVGARLSGSAEADMAVEWGFQKLKSYNFDTVYKQEIKVPHWERGTKESAWLKLQDGKLLKLNILALGGSIGTNGLIKAELLIVNSLEELKKMPKSKVNGKIVLINQRMEDNVIHSFQAYGGCFPIRKSGAVEGARLGAVAVLIRSLSLGENDFPHTGTMQYNDSVGKIAAGAISTNDADKIALLTKNNAKSEIWLEMDCRFYEDKISYNVIGEMWGKNRNEIITFGGHLDSWDAGEGAHDDGAGIAHSIEALRLLKSQNYKPKHTLRCVLFMNEENGNRGGETYATWTKARNEIQIAALESDRGGFSPRGFDIESENAEMIHKFEVLFEQMIPFGLSVFAKGHSGVDVGPLGDEYENITMFGFVPDSQRYFDFHHSANDVFENVNKRELELGCAAIASWLYLIDKYI